jgi:hypothetical protein
MAKLPSLWMTKMIKDYLLHHQWRLKQRHMIVLSVKHVTIAPVVEPNKRLVKFRKRRRSSTKARVGIVSREMHFAVRVVLIWVCLPLRKERGTFVVEFEVTFNLN